MSLTTRHAILIFLGVLFACYVLFQARFIILGPGIAITSHTDGSIVHEPSLTLSGTVRNAAWLTLNDRQIFTDENGHWSEKLILAEGVSIMTIRVKDRFGREAVKSVHLVLN